MKEIHIYRNTECKYNFCLFTLKLQRALLNLPQAVGTLIKKKKNSLHLQLIHANPWSPGLRSVLVSTFERAVWDAALIYTVANT